MKQPRLGLYLDDVRTPTEVPPNIDEWKVVRSYTEFRDFLYGYVKENKKFPELVSLDHDLSTEHIQFYHENQGEPIRYEEFKEKTGLHCAKLMIELAEKNNIPLNYVCVHSHNPIGASNILNFVNFYLKQKGDLEKPCFQMRFKFKTIAEMNEVKYPNV